MLRIAIVIAFALGTRTATADTLLVISDDPAFKGAVVTAVAPDQMSVRVADVATPSLETIAQVSRETVQHEQADAAAWLLFADHGATLIVYDRGVDRVLVRSLPYTGRLDAAQAAEAARVTRTMLRALRVVDDTQPQRPPPAPPPSVVAPAPPPPPPTPTRLAIDLDGGIRMRAPGATATPAGTLGVIWRPDQLGLAIAVRLAPAAELDGMFVGEISDQSVAALARWPMRVAHRIDVVTTAGLAVHRIVLDGTLAGAPREEGRFDPAARIGVAGSFALNPTIGLGIAMSADWLLRRQTYEAGNTELLTVPLIQVGFGLVVTARIL